jgi:hypothetical protein
MTRHILTMSLTCDYSENTRQLVNNAIFIFLSHLFLGDQDADRMVILK